MKKVTNKCPLMPILLLIIAMTLFLVYAAPAIAKQKVIGVSNLWLGNEWNSRVHKKIIDDLEKQGFKVISTNAQGRTNQQKADLENFISMKVDGIIIKGGEGGAFFDVSKKAWDANIPVVTVIMFLPYAVNNSVEDSWQGASNLAVWMTNQMQGSGKYIGLDASGWHTLEVRRDAYESVFKWFPQMKMIGKYHDCLADPVNRGYSITKAALRAHPDLKGVASTWGMPAVGAIKAIKEMGKEKQVCVISIDQEKALLSQMHGANAPATAVAGIEPEVQGELAARAMTEALSYKTVQEAKENIPVVSVIGLTYVATKDVDMFKPKIVYKSLDECWDGNFGKNSKRPWK
jgi:ABC-type sugar transport system substrate-binding protein